MSSPTIAELVAQSKQRPTYHHTRAPKPARVPKGATRPQTRLVRRWPFIWPIPVLIGLTWVIWQLITPNTLRHPYETVYAGLSLSWLIVLEIFAFFLGLFVVWRRLRKSDKLHETPEDQAEKEGSAS